MIDPRKTLATSMHDFLDQFVLDPNRAEAEKALNQVILEAERIAINEYFSFHS